MVHEIRTESGPWDPHREWSMGSRWSTGSSPWEGGCRPPVRSRVGDVRAATTADAAGGTIRKAKHAVSPHVPRACVATQAIPLDSFVSHTTKALGGHIGRPRRRPPKRGAAACLPCHCSARRARRFPRPGAASYAASRAGCHRLETRPSRGRMRRGPCSVGCGSITNECAPRV